jgi:hypothetical protein
MSIEKFGVMLVARGNFNTKESFEEERKFIK